MITFTNMKKQAADNCGLYVDAPEMTKIVQDINIGVKRFQNAARRYYTRVEKKTSLVQDQQFYQFPSDTVRVSSVQVKNGETYYPVTAIRSEEEWNNLNAAASYTSSVPVYYFIRGANEIGLYPTPSGNVTDGLKIAFEPRMVDMAIADTTPNVDVTEGSNIVTANGATFNKNLFNQCWFTITNGDDGNWYKIAEWIDGTHIKLDNNYQGESATGIPALIGQAPSFPEEYHDAPVFFACHKFFLLRKDLESASMYKQLFDAAFAEYRQVYGTKTTGGVINSTKNAITRPVQNLAWPGILRS